MSRKTSKQLLHLWRHAMLEGVRANDPDLTMRQISVMLSVYMTPEPHTVKGLSAELNVVKPVITRALDTLSQLDYIKRTRDENDKRVVHVVRTVKGAVYLSELSERITIAEESALKNVAA